MKNGQWLDLELSVTGLAERVQVRIGSFGERCTASVELGRISSDGIGATAREALVAALSPLGGRTTAAVMAAPAMFGASAQLLAVSR